MTACPCAPAGIPPPRPLGLLFFSCVAIPFLPPAFCPQFPIPGTGWNMCGRGKPSGFLAEQE